MATERSDVTNEQFERTICEFFIILNYKLEFRDGKKVSNFICVGSCDRNVKAILLQIKKQGNLVKRYRQIIIKMESYSANILEAKKRNSDTTAEYTALNSVIVGVYKH